MGLIFKIPNTNFSGSGVPLDQIVPIDNSPVLILNASGYNESTGVWTDSITGKTAIVPSGAVAPSKVDFKGNSLPFFSEMNVNALTVELDNPEITKFTFNYTAYSLTSQQTVRYIFDLIKDAVRFLGTMSYTTQFATSGPKIFSTASSWQDLPTPQLEAGERMVMSLAVDRDSDTCDVYFNGVLIESLTDFVVKPLDGTLYLGRSNALVSHMSGYLANFSIYEGVFDASKASTYYSIMDGLYGA